MMRVGLFKPVHVKTLASQERRMLLTSRKLLQRKLLDVEADLRGTLRNFGLKVGVVIALLFQPVDHHGQDELVERQVSRVLRNEKPGPSPLT